ncbi:MAG: HAD family hydrolase [Defluviitaleaceae bacterium]|nr:HAD family hydrolase [Defluviitaleaceae bacterium]
MFKIKMIATDLDRTLLREDKTVSNYTRSVLKRCMDAGIKVVLATGRPIRWVLEYLDPIPCDAAVYHNGAIIFINGEQAASFGIPHEDVKKILPLTPCGRAYVEINDILYGNEPAEDIWPGIPLTITDFSDKLPKQNADKILFPMQTLEETAAVEKLLPNNYYIQLAENTVGMIMHRDANKLNGARFIARRFGIDLSEVASFGDDYNDVAMLGGAGYGVAVANAIPEAKAAAKFICGSNEEDGVAKWIEKNAIFP